MTARISKISLMLMLVIMQVVMVIGTPGAAQALAADSVKIPILNNSFETDLSMWQTNGSGAISHGEDDWGPPANGGKGRLKYWSSEDYVADTYQTVTGLVYGVYEVSAWAAGGGDFHELYMYAHDASGEKVKVDVPLTGSWTQLKLEIEVSNGGLTVGFYADAAGEAWVNFDLVELKKLSADEPQPGLVSIVNPDFEEFDGSGSLVGWQVQGDTGASFADGGQGYNSAHALGHWAAEDYEVRTYQLISDLDDGYYTLTAWAQHGGGSGVSYLFGEGASRSEARTALPATEEWTKVYVRGIEVTDGTAVIGLHTIGPAGTWSKIDKVELVKDDIPYRLLKGGDVSELTHVESRGGVFYDREGNPKDLFHILKEYGHDIVRLRVYNDPGKGHGHNGYYRPEGIMDKEDILHLARRAKAAGLQIQLTFHYSDYWTNGEQQIIPHEWQAEIEGLTDEAAIVAKLEQLLYAYTKDVMQAMVAQGTTPEYVSLGNEMQGGLLYPYGRASGDYWQNLGVFLKAGYRAVKEVSPASLVILHLDDAGNYGKYTTFFDKMDELGVEYDIIGPSYYPFWTGKTVKEAVEFFNYISDRYDKDIMVMETGYKWNLTLPNGTYGQLTDNGPYPIETSTPEGQKNFMLELFNGLKSAGNGRVIGDLYWDPIMIAVEGVGWAIREEDDQPDVNVVSNTTLFDFEGRALPVHDAYVYNTEGSVTGNIIGVVKGTDGRGIARADVNLSLPSGVRQVKSDAWGNFLFPDVPVGLDYQITAGKAGYMGGTAKADKVVAGQNTKGVEVVVTGGAIAGTVFDEDGQAVAEASISLTVGEDTFTATSDAEGQYVLSDLPGGSGLLVKAAKIGYAEGYASDVTVKTGETTAGVDLIIKLNSGTIAGRVTDTDGQPIAGATASVTVGAATFSGKSDAEGRYEIKNVPAGDGYVVTVHKEQYETVTAEDISVSIGEVTEGVDFVLPSSLGSISGQVTNSSGEPVAGAVVTVKKGDDEYSAVTDEAGAYVVESVPAGSGYVAVAEADGYMKGIASDIRVSARTETKGVHIRLLTPIAIDNASFETRDESDRTIIPGWDVESTPRAASFIQYHAQAVDGEYIFSTWMEQPFVSDVSQTLTDLENGYYRIAAWFYNGGTNEHYLYARSSGEEVRLDIPETNGMTQFSLMAEVTDGELTIGFYVDGDTGNWTNIDAVTIGYLGAELPSDGDGGDGGDGGEPGDGDGGDGITMTSIIDGGGDQDDSAVEVVDLIERLDGETGDTLNIELTSDEDATHAAASIPMSHISEAYRQGIKTINIRSTLANFAIAAGWLSELADEDSTNVEISVAVTDPEDLPADVRERIGDRTVYDLELLVDGEKVSGFGRGDIVIEIPYTLGEGEDPHQVIIYYISDEGELEVVVNGIYNETTGMVSFSPKHFSFYAAAHVSTYISDIDRVLWAKRSIEALAARGIVTIGDDHMFVPQQVITRGQLVELLVGALELEAADHESNFADVQPGTGFYEAISVAEQLGIAKGIGDGLFAPDGSIIRQDLAVFIHRAMQALGIELPQGDGSAFVDEGQIAAYAKEAVEAVSLAGIMNGTGNGEFSPDRTVTRAEAAVVAARLIEMLNQR